MENKKKVEEDPSRPTIRTLFTNLGEAVDFVVDPSFNEELPLQILCKSCGTHLLGDWRNQRLRYRPPKYRFDWCRAPIVFAVYPDKILDPALRAVVGQTPA